jgi:hypothetical protein
MKTMYEQLAQDRIRDLHLAAQAAHARRADRLTRRAQWADRLARRFALRARKSERSAAGLARNTRKTSEWAVG